MLTRADIKVGDTVELNCPGLMKNSRRHSNTIIAKVSQVFDVLLADGTEGNLEIDLELDDGTWIRYKPTKDEGTIRVLPHNYSRE